MNPICHRCRRTNPVMYTHGMGRYLCITCRWADRKPLDDTNTPSTTRETT
jgi:hypothetical protein